MPRPFHDRRDAGRQLAARLHAYAGLPDVIVLGLPRGGIPVAFEVAHELGAPLDVCTARKLGVPGHEEFALGAIASGGACVLHEATIRALAIPASVVADVRATEERELARRDALYRGDRPPLAVEGSMVLLVDDGMATGATMQAAVEAMRAQHPRRIVVAVPVASEQACAALTASADVCLCLTVPSDFHAVGQAFVDFAQTSDDDVHDLLEQAMRRLPADARDGTLGACRTASAHSGAR